MAPERKRAVEAPVEDEAFPRGGADVLTPLERRRITERARADVQQGDRAAKRPRKGQEEEQVGF